MTILSYFHPWRFMIDALNFFFFQWYLEIVFKFTKTLPKCKSVTPWCMFVQLVVEWARATAVAWEQSQFYCFYCCSPPLRHHHRQHHCQHHRQLLFKLSLSLSSFFSLSSSSWPGKNPGFIAFIVVFQFYTSIASTTILPHPQIAR